jgi:hypothetical protein
MFAAEAAVKAVGGGFSQGRRKQKKKRGELNRRLRDD